jgi:hypothetical protein
LAGGSQQTASIDRRIDHRRGQADVAKGHPRRAQPSG